MRNISLLTTKLFTFEMSLRVGKTMTKLAYESGCFLRMKAVHSEKIEDAEQLTCISERKETFISRYTSGIPTGDEQLVAMYPSTIAGYFAIHVIPKQNQ